MRSFNFCEELGSGIDRVIEMCELWQLPAPLFQKNDTEAITIITIYAPQSFKTMSKEDKIRATYLHTCLKAVQGEFMTNQTLRERFQISKDQYYKATRIIKSTLDVKLIKPNPKLIGRKEASYVPFWQY